jgi:hypothetical protein
MCKNSLKGNGFTIRSSHNDTAIPAPTVITNVTISGHLDSSMPEDSDHYIIIQIELWLGESRGEILLFCRYVCSWFAQYIYIQTVRPNCSLALVHSFLAGLGRNEVYGVCCSALP